MRLFFGKHWLDIGRRELWRSGELVAVPPQIFDLIVYLILHRTASSARMNCSRRCGAGGSYLIRR